MLDGAIEASFREDHRGLLTQAASALGVLPMRISLISEDRIAVHGEQLQDIGQLPVVGPLSPEVLYTGALEGDVVETVSSGRPSFFVVAPDASFEPRRRRILESLRKPTEVHEEQTKVYLDVRAVTETRCLELLKEENDAMQPLADLDEATRRQPRDALRRILG